MYIFVRFSPSRRLQADLPCVFHCKPRLIIFFLLLFCAAHHQGRFIYLFHYLIENYKWHPVFVWLRFFSEKTVITIKELITEQTLFSYLFCSASRAHPSQQVVWGTESIFLNVFLVVVVVWTSLPGLRINAKRAGMRKCLRGLGNLCLSATCNQGRLTLIF